MHFQKEKDIWRGRIMECGFEGITKMALHVKFHGEKGIDILFSYYHTEYIIPDHLVKDISNEDFVNKDYGVDTLIFSWQYVSKRKWPTP